MLPWCVGLQLYTTVVSRCWCYCCCSCSLQPRPFWQPDSYHRYSGLTTRLAIPADGAIFEAWQGLAYGHRVQVNIKLSFCGSCIYDRGRAASYTLLQSTNPAKTTKRRALQQPTLPVKPRTSLSKSTKREGPWGTKHLALDQEPFRSTYIGKALVRVCQEI